MSKTGEIGKIEDKSDNSCAVYRTEGVFNPGNTLLCDVLKAISGSEKPRIMLVADSNAVNRTPGIGMKIGKYLSTHGITLAGNAMLMNGGEKIKSDDMHSALRLMGHTLEAKTARDDVMVVFGGGSLMDVAGYVAGQVRGGMKTLRIPTTVSAAVDAAYSFESAIDTSNVKDAFKIKAPPSAVIYDPEYPLTVLDGVWRGGMGEIIRHASVLNGPLMRKIAKCADKLKNRDKEVSAEIIDAAIESRVKKGTNGFALWSALRLESISSYKLPHGYAVPIGICIDCAYAVEKGLMKEEDQELVCRALADTGALDGLSHSNHLLNKTDNILYGIDAWMLSCPGSGIPLPGAIGKTVMSGEIDRAVARKVIEEFTKVSSEE